MALAGSFVPQSIGMSNEFETKSIVVSPIDDPTTQATKSTLAIPKVSFMEQVLPYFSANQELATLNIRDQEANHDSTDNNGEVPIVNDSGNYLVMQDFNIPVFRNKQYNNFSFTFISGSVQNNPLNDYNCPYYLRLVCFYENEKISRKAEIGGDRNIITYLKFYYINKNYTVIKSSDSYQNGDIAFLNKNEILFLLENNNMLIRIPTNSLKTYIEMPFSRANSNYCYLAPLNGIDQIFQHEPKEIYYEALGNKINEVVRKDGIDYLFFGIDGDNNHQVLAFSSKAIDLER